MTAEPPPPPAAAIDPHRLRQALGRFATGVTIVTTVGADGAPLGLTVNSFASLSLEPPLVLWSLRGSSGSLPLFRAAPGFAVNVLTEAQADLSRIFATRAEPHRFDPPAWERGADGLPLLREAAARFVCETVARHPGGDHELFIGRVVAFADGAASPLLFYGGRYRRLGPLL